MVICHMVRFNIIFYLQYSDISEHHIPVTSPVPTQSGLHFFQYPPSLDQTGTALFPVPTQSRLDWYCTLCSTSLVGTSMGHSFGAVPVQSGHSPELENSQYFSSRDIHRYCAQCSTSGCPTRLELEHVGGKSSRSNSSELELLDVPAHFPKHRRTSIIRFSSLNGIWIITSPSTLLFPPIPFNPFFGFLIGIRRPNSLPYASY